jgi:hypothetical protein
MQRSCSSVRVQVGSFVPAVVTIRWRAVSAAANVCREQLCLERERFRGQRCTAVG